MRAHGPGENGRGVLLNQAVQRWSGPGGGARGEQGCHPAHAGATGQWLAREAPGVVRPHGIKPCAAPQALRMPPADVCPLVRGLERAPVCGSDRQLRGGEIRTANVSSGSFSDVPSNFAERPSAAVRDRQLWGWLPRRHLCRRAWQE